MKNTISELETIVENYSARMSSIAEAEFSSKPQPGKWSKKEVVGHLIDSGQNNLRRFICGQYEETPPKIVYQQDFWVAANGYQEYSQENIINLWKLTNGQISAVLKNMPSENYLNTVKTDRYSETEKTLEWLAADYVKHMKHHLNQIFENAFAITYP